AEGKEFSPATLKDIASDYVKAIRSSQPHGPYYIIGECSGGIVAYEMAQQIRALGEPIALLVLMDAPRPDFSLELRRRMSMFFRPITTNHYVAGLSFLLRELRRRKFADKFRYIASKRRTIVREALDVGPTLASPKTDRGTKYIQQSYSRAIYRYRPKVYPGKMTLLVDEESHTDRFALDWQDLVTGGVEVHVLPGDHYTYIRDHAQQ